MGKLKRFAVEFLALVALTAMITLGIWEFLTAVSDWQEAKAKTMWAERR